MQNIETHPLEPFLPGNARILMLGSFPPKKEKRSMEFFYPNFINDMWRIFGIVFFSDKQHFTAENGKKFDKERIVDFCKNKGIALYDSATKVVRLKDNASDKFLEVVERTDLKELLFLIPLCGTIVTTGEKATDNVCSVFGCKAPLTGECIEFSFTDKNGNNRHIKFFRMPSSSRAYPLSLDKKAEKYKDMFHKAGLI